MVKPWVVKQWVVKQWSNSEWSSSEWSSRKWSSSEWSSCEWSSSEWSSSLWLSSHTSSCQSSLTLSSLAMSTGPKMEAMFIRVILFSCCCSATLVAETGTIRWIINWYRSNESETTACRGSFAGACDGVVSVQRPGHYKHLSSGALIA